MYLTFLFLYVHVLLCFILFLFPNLTDMALYKMSSILYNQSMSTHDIKGISPVKLAFLGDAVFELAIRDHMIQTMPQLNNHHVAKRASQYVKATTQAAFISFFSPSLTTKEEEMVKRGRNQHPRTVPKNTPVIQYRMATGFETLIGYLYLTDQKERLQLIINAYIQWTEENILEKTIS